MSEPLVEPLLGHVDQTVPTALAPFNTEVLSDHWAFAATSDWAGPSLEIVSRGPGNTLQTLRLQSHRGADRIVLLLPKTAELESFVLGGIEFPATLSRRGLYKGYYAIYLNGVYDQVIELSLKYRTPVSSVSGYLMDVSTKLPPSAQAVLSDRTGIFTPVHRGDQAFLMRKIEW